MVDSSPPTPPAETAPPAPGLPRPRLTGRWLGALGRLLRAAKRPARQDDDAAFRHAMEDAMTIGLRVFDLRGRITYVNPAFCRMTGWREDELIGQCAPYPYWAKEDYPTHTRLLVLELAGQTPRHGFQMRVRRKDGSLFDARLHVSPMKNERGEQTGWLATMTDISEPAGIRRELAAAQERFITVLGTLDAAVSVAPLDSTELLYANLQYRKWFGEGSGGHGALLERSATTGNVPGPVSRDSPHDLPAPSTHPTATTDAPNAADTPDAVDDLAGLPIGDLESLVGDGPDAGTGLGGWAEVHIERLGLWLEVRSRHLTWVDGRLAQMVIATDITARHRAEELAAAQAEREQTVSRLMTMGEMASSVAHELGQPLTAISNYCHGIVARIRNGRIDETQLLAALEKTARQAQRAGQVIGHIRGFVKRSEPNRQHTRAAEIVEQAVELANIALRRRQVRLTWHCAPGLPPLFADPILIEQVLLNLLKNGAESIDAAQRAPINRIVDLQANAEALDGHPAVRFVVSDTGGGLPPHVLARLYETFFSTKRDGLGIGLSLCRSIVESHQGRIVAENLYNAQDITGCRFTVWIPAATPTENPDT